MVQDKVETKPNRKIYRILCLLLLLTVAFQAFSGCSTDTIYVTSSSTPDFDSERQEVLDTYFDNLFEQQLHTDSAPIIQHYGVNVFSTAHYGTYFIIGTVDLKDVFDARIASNYAIFKDYARENHYILNPDDEHPYYRYAFAATKFMEDYGYDAVLFRPDEYHPVLTQKTDTWLFVRDVPDGVHEQIPGNYWISGRVDERHEAIRGGIPMEPIHSSELWLFYIPSMNGDVAPEYTPYEMLDVPPVSGFSPNVNVYNPPDATPQQLAGRAELGIIESPFSGRQNVPVGTWKSATYYESNRNFGLTFSGDDTRFTWGGYGLYLLPLTDDFWEDPQ